MTVKLQAAKDVRGAIKIIAKKGPELDRLVHDTALQCMGHAMEHGDLTLIAELIGGKFIKKGVVTGEYAGVLAGTGYGIGDLKSWVMGHTPIRFNNSTGAIGIPKDKNIPENWQLDLAEANPFYTHPDYMGRSVNRPPWSMDTIISRVQNMVKSIDRAVEEGKYEGDPEAAKALIAAMLKVEKPSEDPKKVVHPKAANEDAVVTNTDKAEAQAPDQTDKRVAA